MSSSGGDPDLLQQFIVAAIVMPEQELGDPLDSITDSVGNNSLSSKAQVLFPVASTI